MNKYSSRKEREDRFETYFKGKLVMSYSVGRGTTC